MDPYKGELMITQPVKVSVKNNIEGGAASGNSNITEHSIPIIRILYSFHSSGSEIKQLLGQSSALATLHSLFSTHFKNASLRSCSRSLTLQMQCGPSSCVCLKKRVILPCRSGWRCVVLNAA